MSLTTVRVDELPPSTPQLTDIFPFETLSDSALKKATFQDLVDFININSNAFQFEVKTLLVNQAYITDNFDIDGIGTNLCLGWRIATELNGLVTIGQGVGYPVGSFGGSKDAVVVSHSHTYLRPDQNLNSGSGSNRPNGSSVSAVTETTGVSGINKNMQPYLVALKIVKL
jgi:hypothetical protein